MDLPSGFGLKALQARQAVAYARIESFIPNPIHRPTLEKQCEASRGLGLTAATPVFTPGWDDPIRSESHRFVAPAKWASYSITHAYGCLERAPDAKGPYDLCACTYGYTEGRHAQIKLEHDGLLENVVIDYQRKTGRRTITKVGTQALTSSEPTDAMRTATQIVGPEQLLGMQCAVRRKDLAAGAWMEWCVTDAADERLHPALRGAVLRSATHAAQEVSRARLSSRTLQVEPQAWVDAAVFSFPETVHYTVNRLDGKAQGQ